MRRLAVLLPAALLLVGCDSIVEPDLVREGTFVDVAAGDYHSCAVESEGAAYCWGSNGFGQLGDGTRELRTRPVPVAGGHAFRAITAGYAHACGLTTDGLALCWGRGREGQLGTGRTEDESEPAPVAGERRFLRLTAGHAFTCGLADDRTAYCWGANAHGQLGDGTSIRRASPVAVAGGLELLDLSAGRSHACGVTTTGAVYCWGANDLAQLGNGTLEPSATPRWAPTQVAFAAVSAGARTTCGLTTVGIVYCWGAGIARDPDAVGEPASGNPEPVAGDVVLSSVSVGSDSHACGVAAEDRAYCWGYGRAGRLGTGEEGLVTPVPVPAFGGNSYLKVSAGLDHTCALGVLGAVYCWGGGGSGQVGTGFLGNTLVPQLVAPREVE